jgi:hypothetical protein
MIRKVFATFYQFGIISLSVECDNLVSPSPGDSHVVLDPRSRDGMGATVLSRQSGTVFNDEYTMDQEEDSQITTAQREVYL